MKAHFKNLFLVLAVIAGLSLIPAGRVTAQTFTTLHSFTALNSSTNSDGASPRAGLVLSGNILYGTASAGGSSGGGTVFAIDTDGTGFTNLHSFTSTVFDPSSGFSNNGDGANPLAGLILSGNTLYGTAFSGGTSGWGTVFAINTHGTGFTNLHSFTLLPGNSTNSDGFWPEAGLMVSGNTLYGTAYRGGSSDRGTVFALATDGTGFTNLRNFTKPSDGNGNSGTNTDGAYPWAGLILSGNSVYGTASQGDSSANGTVFKVNTNGLDFTTLYSFTATPPYPNATNSDGANPLAGLILSGNTLYGTTANGGGGSGNGTVFALNTDGTGFTNLHTFTAVDQTYFTNSDGADPSAELILSGNTLYGTARNGGSSGNGAVFAVNTDGTGFTTLYSFTATVVDPSSGYPTNSDGAFPQAGLILTNNTLYGAAARGGSSGNGTVFSLSLPLPQLTIIRSGRNAILTWLTNASRFILQSAPAITGTFTNLPGATSPYTNAIAGGQKFYRLSQ